MFRFFVCAALLLCPTGAFAQVLTPPSAPFNWNVGDPNSTAYHWNNFGSGGVYPGPFAPDQASIHPGLSNATVTETTGNAFLTSGGNLYSQGLPMAISALIPNFNLSASPGGAWNTSVFVQTRTLGNEIDYANLSLGWTDGSGPHVLTPSSAVLHQELERIPLGGFGGFSVTELWQFTVPANPAQFTLNFAGALDSVSLDQIRIDTRATPVPEPSSVLLVGGGLLAFWRRRKQR